MLWNPLLNFEVNPEELRPGSNLVVVPTDPDQAIAHYIVRQTLLRDVFLGVAHPDDYLDCLIEQGLSADAYLQMVEGVIDDLA